MDRRRFLRKTVVGVLGLGSVSQIGCRGHQSAQVLRPGESDMVGSHTAGAETYRPLVQTAVSNLLARHTHAVRPAGFGDGAQQPMKICFVGVENESIEEMGDFKEQLYELIDTQIVHSGVYQPISRRYVEAGLQQTRMRPDQLFVPENMTVFIASMQQMGQPFEFLLFAKLTSGTTRDNKDYQRDYLLTLEMVDVRNGQYDKESAMIRKGYNRSAGAKVRNSWPFR